LSSKSTKGSSCRLSEKSIDFKYTKLTLDLLLRKMEMMKMKNNPKKHQKEEAAKGMNEMESVA